MGHVILFETDDEAEAYAFERWTIAEIGFDRLSNVRPGGGAAIRKRDRTLLPLDQTDRIMESILQEIREARRRESITGAEITAKLKISTPQYQSA